jgi:hypothetical protein
MKRIEPPSGLTERPVATPIGSVSSDVLSDRRGGPRNERERAGAEDRAELAPELPHPGLARVALDDQRERVVVDRRSGGQAVLGPEAGDEVRPRDVGLLARRIALELDELEPVEEGRVDLRDVVGRRDEEHVGEVVRNAQVVVLEVRVLLGIEDLEQRRRGAPLPVGADFIDLVEEHDGAR